MAQMTIKAVIPVLEALHPLGSEFKAVSDIYRKQCFVTTCEKIVHNQILLPNS